MIKLCAIDLDGTLYDKNKVISEANKEAIKLAKKNGCKIVIATGRPIMGIQKTLNELELTTNEDYCICYNGAKVYNVGTKECIFETEITGKDTKDLANVAEQNNINVHGFRINEELITPKHNPYTDVESRINGIKDNLFDFKKLNDDDRFLKVMLVDSKENLDRMENVIDPYFKEHFQMVRSATIFLEFLNRKSDKGLAMLELIKYLNIDITETMAIGDAGNDISMIEKAHIGVAMANSFEYVKAYANEMTLSNEESGVAYAINKHINNIKSAQ